TSLRPADPRGFDARSPGGALGPRSARPGRPGESAPASPAVDPADGRPHGPDREAAGAARVPAAAGQDHAGGAAALRGRPGFGGPRAERPTPFAPGPDRGTGTTGARRGRHAPGGGGLRSPGGGPLGIPGAGPDVDPPRAHLRVDGGRPGGVQGGVLLGDPRSGPAA